MCQLSGGMTPPAIRQYLLCNRISECQVPQLPTQFSSVLVNLKGVHHSSGTATPASFMSLYVQLSRAERWDGLHLFRIPARSDFIEPKNVLDKDMRDAIVKLERRGEETRRRSEQDHGHEPWFREWDAMAESAQAAEAVDEEDASLWAEEGS